MRNFTPSEFGEGFARLDPALLATVDDLRDYIGRPIHIHSAYRGGDPGQHGKGRALDISADYTPGEFGPWELWLAASRFPQIMGLGFYPYWNRPGIHIDTREADVRALWWFDEEVRMRPVDRFGMDALREAA